MAFAVDATKPLYGQWRFGYDTNQATMKLFTPGVPVTFVTLLDRSINASVVNPATVSCLYQLNMNGKVQSNINTVLSDLSNWISDASNIGLFEAMVTQVSGAALTGSPLGAWTSLAATLAWGLSRTTVGVSSALFHIQIRRIGTTDILAKADITVSATIT